MHEPGCNEHDRLLAITTISFDMSALELLLPLLSGAAMVIANPGAVRNPQEMIGLMERHEVSILQATPATWNMLLESGWSGRLSKIICGGEPLSRQLADCLLAAADSVRNVYGPAETTYGSVGRVTEDDIVVGKPMINGRIYILDESLSPVPISEEGELFIGGSSVSNGYRNQEALTRSRFLKNPFHDGVFFQTGDLARFIRPGKLQVLGRIDGVVKIYGNRVDVGDVETALVAHADVSAAIVASRDDRLVAYCVVSDLVHHDMTSLGHALRPWVIERLPPYMVPAFFVPMDSFPLSLSEKVDRRALPDPMEIMQRSRASTETVSELEQKLRSVWAEVLGHDHFGFNDNFFHVGGDSVRIVRLQAALQRHLGRRIPIPTLFEHFTIERLATSLAGVEPTEQRPLVARHDSAGPNDDIAIVSMAYRLPGGVATPDDFWQVLQSGRDVISDIPKSRWDAEALYNANPDADGTSYCRRGGFLDSIDSWDSSFFGISPREAQAMHPEQHLMLQLCWEAFERADYTSKHLTGSNTGVFLGISNNVTSNHGISPDLKGYSITGSADATASGRLSYTFGLQGPSMTIDTACSSSLVATHLACSSLRQRECSMALVGGVSLLLGPGIHIEFSRLRGLSADGRCKAFSEGTDGTGFSEGAATMVLKRLSDAETDGDEIHAVLRSSAVLHGGRGIGLTVPNVNGQEALIRTALLRAGLDPPEIDYVEAHGTATKLGDPIEATALCNVFSSDRTHLNPLLLGSAKSNVGHTQAAAGLVGLMKVVLAMKHSIIPRTLHLSEPTRAIEWKNSNLELVMANKPWLSESNRPRRAGVSAFGIGGTNVHAIVEEYQAMNKTPRLNISTPVSIATPQFLLSAKTESALQAQARKLLAHISDGGGKDNSLADIAFSLATSRTHFERILAIEARDKREMLEKLASVGESLNEYPDTIEDGKGSLGMLFAGQGSQWVSMGKDLYELFPIFRQSLDELTAQFRELGLDLLEVMWSQDTESDTALLHRTDYAQPALFTLEVSLWKLWQSLGVEADYLLGHSIGELAAAHVAGVMDVRDACRLVMMRGRLMQAVSFCGGMTAVQAGPKECEAAITSLNLGGEVQIAGYNAPLQTVLAGSVDALEVLEAHFAALAVRSKRLEASHAFHSHHMDEMLINFEEVARTVHFHAHTIPIVSSMTGLLAREGELQQPAHWVQQVRKAVRFHDAMSCLARNGTNVCIEIGPSATLCGLGAACLADVSQAHENLWLPSLRGKNEDAVSMLQHAMGQLYVHGFSLDWAAFYRNLGCRTVALPTYAFQPDITLPVQDNKDWLRRTTPSAEKDSTVEDWHEMVYEVNWRAVPPPQTKLAGSWGFLCPAGETSWTKQVEQALFSSGVNLKHGAGPCSCEGLDGIISVWDSDTPVLQTVYDVITPALAQCHNITKAGTRISIIWIARQSVGTGIGDQSLHVGTAPLLGLIRSARSEQPELCLRLINVDESAPLGLVATALAVKDVDEIAIRGSQLLQPHFKRISKFTTTGQAVPSCSLSRLVDGYVMVTGGLGDIGQRVAERLATRHGVRKLMLVSRRGMQTAGADAIVARLTKLGAEVTVIACDLANLEALKLVVERFTIEQPLRGIIHTAGLVDSGTLSSLTPEKFASVFAPKVDGLWNLHRLTEHMDLEFFVMFSSISGILGLPGLANYAAANTFVDAVAYMRRAKGLPATSLAYGTWNGDGMTTTLGPATRAHLAQLGLGYLEPAIGVDLLEQAVLEERVLSVPAVLDLPRLKSYHQSQGNVPPILRSLLGAVEGVKPANTPVNLLATLAGTSPEKHNDIVLRMAQATVAKALGHVDSNNLHPDRALQEYGIDSLTAVLVRNHLAKLTGLTLQPNIALLHPNLRSLAESLTLHLNEASGVIARNNFGPSPVLDISSLERGVLDPIIQFKNVANSTPTLPRPKAVLVTGATGFVGAFMVSALLDRGMKVHSFVRAGGLAEAHDRMITTLQQYGLQGDPHYPLMHEVVGDLSKPLFGLCQSDFDDLADKIDAIVHSGALVDWMRPLRDYIAPNVLGTHEVLRLASIGRRKSVHFISTISTLPIHSGYGLTEADGEQV